jgi:hypothetical protein
MTWAWTWNIVRKNTNGQEKAKATMENRKENDSVCKLVSSVG